MILVSRTLSDGRQLEIRTTPDREVITTIGGVVQCLQTPKLRRSCLSSSFRLLLFGLVTPCVVTAARTVTGTVRLAAHNGEWVSSYRGHKMRGPHT